MAAGCNLPATNYVQHHHCEVYTGQTGMSMSLLSSLKLFRFTHSKRTLQKSSDDELQFARAVAIHDLEVSPSVPPPFNILYSVAVIIAYICSHWFTKVTDY